MKLYLSWIPIRISDGFDFKSLIFFTGLEDLLGFLDVKKQETRLNCASKHGVSTKGQLISKRLLEKIIWTKIATKKFSEISALASKERSNQKLY